MSIIGHLLCLALATPTMTDKDELESVQSVLEARIIQIVSKTGNATKAMLPKGQAVYDELIAALDRQLETGFPRIFSTIGQDERGNNVPFTIVLADVNMVMLFPPPSGLATPSGISLVDPRNPPRH